MNDFASLRILDRFRPVFQKLKIDYDVMRLILQLKLTMDSRRMPAIFSGSNVKKRREPVSKILMDVRVIWNSLFSSFSIFR